jgi:MscS family membrane protein
VDELQDFLNKIVLDNRVENLLWFAGIVLALIIFSRWITRAFSFLLYRLFRRLSFENRFRQFVDGTHKPFSLFIILFAVFLSFDLLKYPGGLDFEIHGILLSTILIKAYVAVMVFVLTWLLLRITNFVASVFLARAARTESTADDQMVLFSKDISKALIVIMSIFFVLGVVFKLNITSLLAGAGIVGLALAFAAKESIENFFGSLTIFADKPFSVGDLVQVGNITGTVEKVGFRSTRIRTVDKTFVTIPNRTLNTDNTENLTLRTYRRVKMFVGVTYDTPAEKIQEIIKDIQSVIDNHQMTSDDGIVALYEFGESSINIVVNYFIHNLDWNQYLKIREEVNFEIMSIVDRHGSSFAFPTRTVHLSGQTN